MILSNAALNWASLRSGMSLHEFLSTLTPEREQEILKAYNDWRRSKGLPDDKPVAPAPSAPTPPPAKREESAIEQLMEQIADEVEKEQEEDAILIGKTMEAIESTPVEWVPEEIVEEIATVDEDEEGSEEPTEEPVEEVAPEEVPASSISDRFATIARKLPREGDPDLYSQILEQLGGSVEALRMAAQITWEEYRRRHKGTAAISAFLNWLNGQSTNAM